MDKVTRLAELMIKHLVKEQVDLIIAPAMGGLVIGQEVARQLGARFIFLEKVNDMLALRRNFEISCDDRVLLVEDVVTRGGRVKEALKIVRDLGGIPVAVTVIVDRSGSAPDFGTPFHSLAALTFPTFTAEELPPELAEIPITKPGS